METIVATAFGRVVDIQRGEHDELTDAAAEIFRGNSLLTGWYFRAILSKLHEFIDKNPCIRLIALCSYGIFINIPSL